MLWLAVGAGAAGVGSLPLRPPLAFFQPFSARREGVRATWFAIGERARRHPELMRAITADGHEVANHCWTERPTWRMGREEFRRDLLRADAAIAPHAHSGLMRPASGWFRLWMLDELRALGLTPVLGSAY